MRSCFSCCSNWSNRRSGELSCLWAQIERDLTGRFYLDKPVKQIRSLLSSQPRQLLATRDRELTDGEMKISCRHLEQTFPSGNSTYTLEIGMRVPITELQRMMSAGSIAFVTNNAELIEALAIIYIVLWEPRKMHAFNFPSNPKILIMRVNYTKSWRYEASTDAQSGENKLVIQIQN